MQQLTEANAARNLGVNIIPAQDLGEAFLMVETDRAVAFVNDDILLASFVAGSKEPDAYVISRRRSRSRSPTASYCARTIRPSRRWSTPLPLRSIRARKVKSCTTNGSCRKSLPRD